MGITTVQLHNQGDPICYSDGTPYADSLVTFQLVKESNTKKVASLFDAVSGEYVPGKLVSVTTDQDGLFSTPIWPNTRGEFGTLYKVELPAAEEVVKPFFILITDEEAGSLSLVQAKSNVEIVTATELSLFQALLSSINAKLATATSVVTATVNGLMSWVDKKRLDMLWGTCVYAHAYTTLAAADEVAVSAGVRLVISTVWATVPTTLNAPAVQVLPGGKLNGSGSVAISGAFEGADGCFGTNQTVTGLKKIDPAFFVVNTVPGTTNMSSGFSRALQVLKNSGGGTLHAKGKYRLDTTVLVDGWDGAGYPKYVLDTANAEFYFYGSGGAFQFLHTNNPVLTGGNIYLMTDSADVYGLHLKHCRYGNLNADIHYLSALEASYASDNIAVYLESGPSDTYDNLYNLISGRARHTGWGTVLNNVDPLYSRNNSNNFTNFTVGSRNGIKLIGSSGNEFNLALESKEVAVSLNTNAAGVTSEYNVFNLLWFEPGNYTYSTHADDGCDKNLFDISFGGYDFSITGDNTVAHTRMTHYPQNGTTNRNDTMGGIASKNYLKGSESIGDGNYGTTNVTVALNNAVAPDGAMTASLLTPTVNAYGVDQSAQGLTAGTDIVGVKWVASVWLRADTPHTAQLTLNSATDTFLARPFYVTTEWKRYYVERTFAAGTAWVSTAIVPTRDGSTPLLPVHAWGLKLEKGSLSAYTKNGGTITRFSGGITSSNDILGSRLVMRVTDNTASSTTTIEYRNAMPSTGAYVMGDIVFTRNPAVLGTVGSKYTLGGWTRLTTSSNHVLNTDWSEMRMLNGQ